MKRVYLIVLLHLFCSTIYAQDKAAFWNFENKTRVPVIDKNGGSELTPGPGIAVELFPSGYLSKDGLQYKGWPIKSFTPNCEDYYQVKVNLENFENIHLSFAEKRDPNGIRKIQIGYSLDGYNFNLIPETLLTIPDNTQWRVHDFNFEAFTSINNQSDVYFRIYGYDCEDHQTNWKIDSVLVSGKMDSLPVAVSLPDSLSFVAAVGKKNIQTFNLRAFNLNSNLHIQSNNNAFTVSKDGINFLPSLTFDSNQNFPTPVYIKFSPQVPNPVMGLLTLTSTGINETINLYGNFYDNLVLWTFEDKTKIANIDINGGAIFSPGPGIDIEKFRDGYNSKKSIQYKGWPIKPTEPKDEDYLQLKVNLQDYEDIHLSFAERRDGKGIRYIQIGYSTNGINYTIIPQTLMQVPDNLDWRWHNFDLSHILAINNHPNVFIRIYGFDANNHGSTWRFDDVLLQGKQINKVPALSLSEDTLVLKEDMVNAIVKPILLSAKNLTDSIYVTASYGFEVSLDSSNFANLVKIEHNTNFPLKLYVKYVPTSILPVEGAVVASVHGLTDKTYLKGDINLTPVYEIQGNGKETPLKDQIVVTEGVVTAVFQNSNQLRAFFIQDKTGDGNVLTSDGIFVYAPSAPSLSPGLVVRVKGKAVEYFEKTELTSVSEVLLLDTVSVPIPVQLHLPLDSSGQLEQYEGMLVQFSQSLTVTEHYNLGRYGELLLSANGKLYQPTEIHNPVTNPGGVASLKDLNQKSKILLDDGSTQQNPIPVPFLDSIPKTLRTGSTVENLTGVLDYAFDLYRLQPASNPIFNYAARPDSIPGLNNPDIKIAGFNVLNYFTTINDGNNGARGANSPIEFERQTAKLVNALIEIDADVFGLVEMENDQTNTLQFLVNKLNQKLGSTIYSYVAEPSAPFGTDPINNAIIFKHNKVTPIAGSATTSNDTIFKRPPLAQVFSVINSNEQFIFITNHFKSKGNFDNDATGADDDQGDGQGFFNYRRKLQSQALISLADSLKTAYGVNDVLLVGDFNAYAQEEPLQLIQAGGYSKLNTDYSYVFDGEWGSLDHVFASPSIQSKITGTSKWHINSDEPRMLDYNTEFNPAELYDSSFYRTSDHDPVVIGLKFNEPSYFGLKILHNNDGESKLLTGEDGIGGVARFKTKLNTLRSQAENETVFLSSGDNFLAGPEFNAGLNNPEGIFDAITMDNLGYDAICLGNHDFDFGPDILEQFIKDFNHPVPFLSANLNFSQEQGLQALVNTGRIAKSVVLHKGNEQIGIVGATTPTLKNISSPRNVIVKEHVAQIVQHEIDSLTNLGINKIILIAHLQSIEEDTSLVKSLVGVDVVIAGGGDELLGSEGDDVDAGDLPFFGSYPLAITDSIGDTVYIVTTPGEYKYVGNLDVRFNQAGEVIEVLNSSKLHIVRDNVERDSTLTVKVENPVDSALNALENNIIATSEVDLDGLRNSVRYNESNLGNLVADALLWQANKLADSFNVDSANIGLQNGGGIRNNSILLAGDISELNTFEVLPFANFVSIVENVTPSKLKEMLENMVSAQRGGLNIGSGRFAQISGMSFVWDSTATSLEYNNDGNIINGHFGERIVEAKLKDGTYIIQNDSIVGGAPNLNIAIVDFSAKGGDQYPLTGFNFTTLGVTYQQALYNYLTAADGLNGIVDSIQYPEGGEGRISFTSSFLSTEKSLVNEIKVTINSNPFEETLNLSVYLPNKQNVKIKLYDLEGKLMGLVTDKMLPKGNNTIEFKKSLSSGTYLVTLEVGDKFQQVFKVIKR